MTNAIDKAVEEAAAAAAAAANTPAVQENTLNNSAVAPVATASSQALSVSSLMASNRFEPNVWLSLKDTGMKLDKGEKAVIDSFECEIDFSQVKFFEGMQITNAAGSAEYFKTYDMQTEASSGKPWSTAIAEATARSVKEARTYKGADILLSTTDEIKQGSKSFEVGTKVGHSTPNTGFSTFMNFLKECVEKGLVQVGEGDKLSGVVKVKAFHIEKTNANKNTWGILGYELI